MLREWEAGNGDAGNDFRCEVFHWCQWHRWVVILFQLPIEFLADGMAFRYPSSPSTTVKRGRRDKSARKLCDRFWKGLKTLSNEVYRLVMRHSTSDISKGTWYTTLCVQDEGFLCGAWTRSFVERKVWPWCTMLEFEIWPNSSTPTAIIDGRVIKRFEETRMKLIKKCNEMFEGQLIITREITEEK